MCKEVYSPGGAGSKSAGIEGTRSPHTLARRVLGRRGGNENVKTSLTTLAMAALLLHAGVTAAAGRPGMGRVAILGPSRSAIVPRLQRNFAESPALLSSAVVTSCSRVTVGKQLYELDADTAICTDGDVVSVWRADGSEVRLIEAVPVLQDDDRGLELLCARVTIAARTGRAQGAGSTTIITDAGVSSKDSESFEAADIMARANETATTTLAPPYRDAPPTAPPPPERVAPRALLALGPMLLASKAGSSFAMSAAAELGLGQSITIVPWFATVPVPVGVETSNGSASYRPTLLGIGFGIPLRSWRKTLVPRLGAGYALLWMHTWPETARNGTSVGDSEDLWAPAMYANAALSVRVTENIRVAAEGMLGTATHHLVVRIARENTDSWGVPLASLGARAELVLP